jgi:hypothetical protein
MDSDYPFGIFKLFLVYKLCPVVLNITQISTFLKYRNKLTSDSEETFKLKGEELFWYCLYEKILANSRNGLSGSI